MNHTKKIKLARKMRTPEEIRNNVGIFNTEAWSKRVEARRKRELARTIKPVLQVVIPQETVDKRDNLYQRVIQWIRNFLRRLFTI